MDLIVNMWHGTCAHNCLASVTIAPLLHGSQHTDLRHGASAHVGPSCQIREELGSGVVGKAGELGGEQVRRILRGACGGHQAASRWPQTPTHHERPPGHETYVSYVITSHSGPSPAGKRGVCSTKRRAALVSAQGSGGAG